MTRGGNRLIWYVDGFAGPGTYDDGSEGSPLLGLRHAGQILEGSRGYQLGCFLVEKQLKNWRFLEEISAPFRTAGVMVRNVRGEFAQLVPEIERETSASPILLFVDPFGLSPLIYSQFQILLRRPRPIDLILTFQHRALHRLAKEHPNIISAAIGTDAWIVGWDAATDAQSKVQHVLAIFANNVQRDGNFFRVFSYPIRERLGRAPRYYLLFASRHYDAFELWNDQVAHEESTLTNRRYRLLAGQTTFLPEFDEEIAGINLLNDIRTLARTQERLTRREIVMYFVQYRWRQYPTREVKRAVRSLLDSGELVRAHAPGISIDNDILRPA